MTHQVSPMNNHRGGPGQPTLPDVHLRICNGGDQRGISLPQNLSIRPEFIEVVVLEQKSKSIQKGASATRCSDHQITIGAAEREEWKDPEILRHTGRCTGDAQ